LNQKSSMEKHNVKAPQQTWDGFNANPNPKYPRDHVEMRAFTGKYTTPHWWSY
jgi:hypothetical protein